VEVFGDSVESLEMLVSLFDLYTVYSLLILPGGLFFNPLGGGGLLERGGLIERGGLLENKRYGNFG
jgi:hypothetical protein